ncbi:hypothetical protein Tco_1144282 [Tanacetum coccineum]
MMASLSEDINSVGSDTHPPMLDRSDFESWQRPFKMGKFKETLTNGAQGPKQDRVFKVLTPEEKDRHKADQHEAHANENKMMLERYTQHAIDHLAFVLCSMENLSSADPIYDEAGPSYDSDIVSEVQDHDNYLDSVDEYQEVHKMHNDGQQKYVVNSDAEYTSDGNIIPLSNVSLRISKNKVVNESLTVELARYKEQVGIYEKRARFELTEREQKIDEQLRIIITNRNIQEESLKRELYSVKMQLNSTIDHNKLMKEEVATLKKDFKQKENKYLEDFLDMKELKEKVEDKLFKQD